MYIKIESRNEGNRRRHDKALNLSAEFYFSECQQYWAVHNERVRIAKEIAMAAIASEQARFVACELAALTFTGPALAGERMHQEITTKTTPPQKTDKKQKIK